jgi:hypothetical protein
MESKHFALNTSDFNPEKHSTRIPYVHLFAFPQNVSLAPFDRHHLENTSS